MSNKIRPSQYADQKGIMLEEFRRLVGAIAGGTTVPADGTSGYGEGCLWLKRGATALAGSLYVNEGSSTSCDFNPLGTGGLDLTTLTATATELNTLHNQTLAVEAGAGITGGTGTVYKSSNQKNGGIYYTQILLDLTGLGSSTTDLDIIGQGASAAHIGQITAARNGTILYGRMTCIEVPVTGVTDIDLYSATEATGVFDGGIAALTETALVTSGGAWTLGTSKHIQDLPLADQYLYITCGAAGTVGTYTAGKFLFEFYGY